MRETYIFILLIWVFQTIFFVSISSISGPAGSIGPIVLLELRPSKTTLPQMKFPDFIESMNSAQDGNDSEAPDFTCRRLSIKFFDVVHQNKDLSIVRFKKTQFFDETV